MTVIYCPYVDGMLNSETRDVILSVPIPHRFVAIDPLDPYAYSRLLRRIWQERRTAIIVEHDVIPTYAQLTQIATCGHEWCGFRYSGRCDGLGGTLGCARFGAHLMRRYPLAAQYALHDRRSPRGDTHWQQVDQELARDLRIRGAVWSDHGTLVHHALR